MGIRGRHSPPVSCRTTIAVAVLLLLVAGAARAGVIRSVDLDSGRDRTALAGPVWAPSPEFRLQLGEFTHRFDFDQRAVDTFGGSGSKDRLDPAVDLGALFGGELARQARELGLTTGPDGWHLSGVVEDLMVRNREVAFGPLLFFGHIDVRLTVTDPAGEVAEVRYRFHPTSVRFNAGFGSRDENAEAIAQFLIEAAQETLARLNRQFFRQQPVAGVQERILELHRTAADPDEDLIRWLGIAGDVRAIEPLLAAASGAEDESARAEAVEALGILGADVALPELRARYAKEEAEVRCAILATVAELDPAGAATWLSEADATRERSRPCQFLALRLLGRLR